MRATNQVDDLFELLAAGCAKQFNFNLSTMFEQMRHVGDDGCGTHYFCDHSTSAQIALDTTTGKVKLIGNGRWWDTDQKEEYLLSDTDIKAEEIVRKEREATTERCAFYRAHQDWLLSLDRDSPTYQPDRLGPKQSPFSAVTELLCKLAREKDPGQARFAQQMGTVHVDRLAYLLLSAAHAVHVRHYISVARKSRWYPKGRRLAKEWLTQPRTRADTPVRARLSRALLVQAGKCRATIPGGSGHGSTEDIRRAMEADARKEIAVERKAERSANRIK